MAYEKQEWLDKETVISSARMEHIEDGLSDVESELTTMLEALQDLTTGLQAQVDALAWSEWEDLPLAAGIIPADHSAPPQIRRRGTERWLRGRLTREDGTNFAAGSNPVAMLKPRDVPTFISGSSAETSGLASVSTSRIEILMNGEITASNGQIATSWFSLDNTFYEATNG